MVLSLSLPIYSSSLNSLAIYRKGSNLALWLNVGNEKNEVNSTHSVILNPIYNTSLSEIKRKVQNNLPREIYDIAQMLINNKTVCAVCYKVHSPTLTSDRFSVVKWPKSLERLS